MSQTVRYVETPMAITLNLTPLQMRFINCACEAQEVVFSYPPGITDEEFFELYGVTANECKKQIAALRKQLQP